MTKTVALISIILLFGKAGSKAPYQTKLIYSNTFDSIACLDDWQMEGPGVAIVENGKLILHSKYAPATIEYLNKKKPASDNGVAYYDFVEKLVEEDTLEDVNAYKVGGDFAGGHVVLWNKIKTPDNYILEFDFQNSSGYALHMIMFSHLGLNGESVFSPKLKPRNGLAAQYTKSDMSGYRISFFAPKRTTTHLRKSPERQLLAKGKDITIVNKNATYHMRVVKHGNKVAWQVNGQTAFVYTESDDEKILANGFYALRQMVPAIGLYDNIKVYEIID